MRRTLAVIGIFRLNNCILGSLAVFIPLAVSSGSITESLAKSLPIFFIGMCTYIINDLQDLEKDRVNHPDRALPSQSLSETVAALLYFACLGIALASIRLLLEPREAWLYYLGLILVVNYNYAVEYFPNWKSPYVAVTVAVPLFIVAQNRPHEPKFWKIALAVALFNLGREICKDIQDAAGDKASIAHSVSPACLSKISFSLQAVAVLILAPFADSWMSQASLVAIVIMYVAAMSAWFRNKDYHRSVRLMKVALFLGLIILL